ncbi:MAG: formylglycine-generating enzyme family protein [Myxococcales bacterium]|nr:formylglycine-generating enzyme family protein [Myxococcales bacterium]
MRRFALRTLCVPAAALTLAACAEGKDPPTLSPVVKLEGGTFTMGSALFDPCGKSSTQGIACTPLEQSEIVPHAVSVDAYCIDRNEVTVEQYRHCVARGECSKPLITNTGKVQTPSYIRRYYNEPDTYGDHPVVGVTHDQARAFCESKGGRLPTEAEWEYAATSRGERSLTVWPDTDAAGNQVLIELACPNNRGDLALGECSATVRPVGSSQKDITAQGVMDMAGNVSEWVADEFDFLAYCADDAGYEVVRPQGQDNFARFSQGVPGGLVADANALAACDAGYFDCEQVCRRVYGPYYDRDLEQERNEAFTAELSRAWQWDHCFTQFNGKTANIGDLRGESPNFMCDPNDTRWCDTSAYPEATAETCQDYCGCLTADLAGAPQGGNACINTCVDEYSACLGAGAATAGAVVACNRENSRKPSPWCLPKQGQSSRDVVTGVPPRLSFYESDTAYVVRGADVSTALACEARPTRRQARNGAVSVVGFRCAYDLQGNNCPR